LVSTARLGSIGLLFRSSAVFSVHQRFQMNRPGLTLNA
jgi:hypothetical protein